MRDSSKGVWGSVPPIPPCASACHTPGAESWRCGRHHAPERLPRRTPTTPLESASGLGGNSASARSVGESSACRVEPQALPWWSSSVLLPLPGLGPTVPTTAGRRHAGLPKAHTGATQEKPANATHWSTRTMAEAAGLSEKSVRRIWHKHGLKPHLSRTFKVSNDPEFAEELEAIVGLYLNPPEHAVVLCADEKSQIQALDRTQPRLPIKKGRCGTSVPATLPSGGIGAGWMVNLQSDLTNFMNNFVVTRVATSLAAFFVLRAILDTVKGGRPLPSILAALLLLAVQTSRATTAVGSSRPRMCSTVSGITWLEPFVRLPPVLRSWAQFGTS